MENTNLKFASSNDPFKIIEYVTFLLDCKIEIKGNPVPFKNKWFLWFNLPDDYNFEIPWGDIDQFKSFIKDKKD